MYAEELLLLLLALGIVGWAVLVAPIICLVGISRLKGRIARLEEQLALTAAAPATARRAATPSPPPPPPPPERAREAAVPPAPAPAPVREAPVRVGDLLETEVALKWLGRVGVLALVIAALFFLQYAFQNRWIGPLGQVSLGIAAGLLLLVAGERNRALKRVALGEALTGGGLAVLYASIYAAHVAYAPPLLERTPAFAFMVLVTALGVAIAVRAAAHSTAIMATLGGFLTPILVGGETTPAAGAGSGSMTPLFGYLTVLALGLLVLSAYRQWRSLQILSLVGTWTVAWGWMGRSYRPELLPALLPWVIGFFLIFTLMPVIKNLRLRLPLKWEDLGLILANPALFFPTLMWLLPPAYDVYLGACAIAMAAAYLVLANLSWGRMRDDRALPLSWLGVGLAFVVIAVPLQLQGHWIMLGWAAEGAVLVWIGLRMRMLSLRGVGLALLATVAGWMLLLYALEPYEEPGTFVPLANEVFLTFLGGFAAIAVALCLYSTSRLDADDLKTVSLSLTMALAFLGLWGLTAEVGRAVPSSSQHAFAISLLWSVYGAATVGIGMARKHPPLRKMGLAVFGLSVLKVFIYDLGAIGGAWRILSFVTLGLVLVGVSWLYHRYGEWFRAFMSSEPVASAPSPGAPTDPAEERKP